MVIITAEEFLQQRDCIRNVEDFYNDVQPIDLIEFAKLHVAAAIKVASDNLEYKLMDSSICHVIDISIFDDYPLTNIK